MKQEEHEFVKLARETIEEYILDSKVKKLDGPLPPIFQRKAGVFVSLKKHGELRGCIGTIQSTMGNIADEIIHNAICAASRDPRFPVVRPEELKELEISVDLLGQSEKINGIDDLDPVKYGVIVEKGYRRGLLLPDIEGVNTPEEQVEIARRKAGIPPGVEVELFRFEVKRYR
jgi:AmmeMemoRadiSam system protein A